MKTRLLKCDGVVLYRAEHLHFEVLEYAENCPSELHGNYTRRIGIAIEPALAYWLLLSTF